ncbi:MAG: Wzz/FepE/Etk N-terminal domain-containing protein, partial [Culicoidibacterales bacterium]
METTELNIDIKDIMYILKKRLNILIIIPVILAIAAGIYSSFVLTPIYQANVNILINRPLGEGGT